MARNTVSVEQVVNDFILNSEQDDYAKNVSAVSIRNFALRGIREMGFDMMKRIKSLKMTVDQSNGTIELPDDFVDLTKLGYVGADGLVYVFGENKNLNYSMEYVIDGNGNRIDSNDDGVYDRQDAKTYNPESLASNRLQEYVFRNYLSNATDGRMYGYGGGNASGDYRINYEQNRIEVATSSNFSEVVIEYIADEALSVNPTIHKYAESALMAYIYYKIVEKKASVPANEKARARQEYYNERRIANSRIKSFSKEDAIRLSRKNFLQSPKY